MKRAAAMLFAAILTTGGVVTAQTSAGAAPLSRQSTQPPASEVTVLPIQVTGDPAQRFSMVILGDGYTAADRPKFRADVDRHLNTLWSIEPYRTYRNYFDVYAVETPSKDSGISCDPDVTSPRRDTPLATALWGGCDPSSVQRALVVGNEDAARQYAAMATPHYDQILVLGNSNTYGGVGGTLATATGGNALSALISPHELGHSLGGLQDEYDYYFRGVPGDPYTDPEPDSVHLTTYTTEQMQSQHLKWWRWLGVPSEAGGVIGRYEGGSYTPTGIWRPSRHSIMRSLGYQYDQVSRERMTQRISQQAELITAATPTTAPVPANDVVWVETPYPVFHQLDVIWSRNGQPVAGTGNARNLDLGRLGARPGDTIGMTVQDPTDFVRDPAIRATMTTTRTWTVGPATPDTSTAPAAFTGSTATDRPLDGTEVVYAYPTHPAQHTLVTTWRLDGANVSDRDHNDQALDLAAQHVMPGTHTLTATVNDPSDPSGGSQTLSWTVDNTAPSTDASLSAPLIHLAGPDGTDHYVFSGQFGMKLSPTDDQPGFVEPEFRLDHDGWTNYYGWPTDPNAPFLFTPTGTVIDSLVYGNLGPEGMSLPSFEPRTPGYGGVHTVEYRSVDTAGNLAAARQFDATVLPSTPACTTTITGTRVGPLALTSGVTCLAAGARVVGPIRVGPGASLLADRATLNGSLTAAGAATVQLVDTALTGSLRVSGTTGELTLLGNHVIGPLTLTGNSTAHAATVAGNAVVGPLSCTTNTPAPSNIELPNHVVGPQSGQCGSGF